MMTDAVLALDQGTTSSRAIVFDREGRAIASASRALTQHYPRPGWVEHDPREIWETTRRCALDVVTGARELGARIVAVGVANQRETTVVWDRRTGEPLHNAIVWQDRRTTARCEALRQAGFDQFVQERTGLLVDPYFSATKLAWMLDEAEGLRARAERGEVAFGTVDSWLAWQLTGGGAHVTDTSNASRTMLMNLARLEWDEDILRELRIPRPALPDIVDSDAQVGLAAMESVGIVTPVCCLLGDQQAAAFGQCCFEPGMAKQTYGTGSFLLMNVGSEPRASGQRLLSTVAWTIGGETTYALEGSSFVAGAGVHWLRDELGIIKSAAETDQLARQVDSSGGAVFVPAFAGLGAPWWDPTARGALMGLTRGTGRPEIVRAVLEAVAYQTRDVVEAMERDSGMRLSELRVDGGMADNEFLMQFQADVLGRPVVRSEVTETTALGAAYLAGLAAGLWSDMSDIAEHWRANRQYSPSRSPDEMDQMYRRWMSAVERTLDWAESDA